MRILGIDPGSRIMGWAVIESAQNGYRHVDSGVIRTKAATSIPGGIAGRLWLIFTGISHIIDLYAPDGAAIETAFFSRNQQSSFVLVQAATAAMMAVLVKGLVISEYQPMMIKKALTGYGRAEKEQVQLMVKRLLGVDMDMLTDRSDAMAVAICHINSSALNVRLKTDAVSY